MAFIQDIKVDILAGAVSFETLTFRILVLGTAAAAKASQIVSEASQLLTFGYTSEDAEFKKALAIFSQQPRPKDIMVARKADATGWDTALDAQRIVNDAFWGLNITSVVSVDLYVVEDWAGANKKFFYGLSSDIGVGNGRNGARAAYMVHDKLLTAGVASVSSSGAPFLGGNIPALPNDTYDLDVVVDKENSSNPYQLAVALLVSDDFDGIAAKIETALQSASSTSPTVVILDGKIVITSDITGKNSNIIITDGTAGNVPLLDFIEKNVDDITPVIDSPVPGLEIQPEAAHISRKLAREPWRNWKWIILNGIPASGFNLTQLDTIRNNKTNTVTTQKGQAFTNGGFAVNGSYIDLVYSADRVEDELVTALLSLLVNSESVPLTDDGISTIEGVIRGVLNAMGRLGIIAKLNDNSSEEDRAKSDDGLYMYILKMPKRSDLSTNDRANRLLSMITFDYTVAGAVDEMDVQGKFVA